MNAPRSYRRPSAGTLRKAQELSARRRRPKNPRMIAAAVVACASFALILSMLGGGGSALPESVKVSDTGIRPESELRCPHCRNLLWAGELRLESGPMATCPECGKRFHIGHARQKAAAETR